MHRLLQILSKFGYKNIDVCYDGNQAVEAAERTRYDLMLMDLQVRYLRILFRCSLLANSYLNLVSRCPIWTDIQLGN